MTDPSHSASPNGALAGYHHRLRRTTTSPLVTLPALIAVAATLISTVGYWHSAAYADAAKMSAVDQIDQSYSIPVTNPADHVTLAAVLVVSGAELTNTRPDGSNVMAPKGEIYLTFEATCGPAQVPYTSAASGHFFSTMTPLPATALHYVSASGRRYPATRINAITQTNNNNAASDNGLFDATYYFAVPITNRSGSIVISPSPTVGTEFHGFVGQSSTALVVGGPTTIPVKFPKELTVMVPPAPSTNQSSSLSATKYALIMNLLETLVSAVVVGWIYLVILRRRRWHRPAPASPPTPSAPSVFFIKEPRGETAAPASAAPAEPAVVVPAHVQTAPTGPTEPPSAPRALRVDVIGPLAITPLLAPASDPVRAILAFLALHTDHVLTLEEIQNAVWPLTEGGTDIKRPAMRNYMVDARRAVGGRHLPTASGRAGYQLVDVESDWAEFRRLRDRARALPTPDATARRQGALALVRGLPFAGDTSRYFAWAHSTSVVYQIVEDVTALAHRVATDLVLNGDLKGAEDALRRGLLVDPASLVLWEDLTDVVVETGHATRLARHWQMADLVLRGEDVVALRARVRG